MRQHLILCGITIFFLSTVHLTLQKSTHSSPYYTAAVVEYSPFPGEQGNMYGIVKKNVAKYEKLISEASSKDADIILFPGYGLVTLNIPRKVVLSPDFASYLPDAKDLVNPCVDDRSNVSEAVHRLSCLARKHKLYVVVCLPEIQTCENSSMWCPPSGMLYHLTCIALDRLGTIVAKYRKYNLLGEPGISSQYTREVATFDTDFGVKFGILSTMDIMYENPTLTLIRDLHITDFLYGHFWVSELPFLTALQIQSAWSRSFQVNMLASGYNDLKRGLTGSGIHTGDGCTKIGIMTSNITTKLLVESVPKLNHPRFSDLTSTCTKKPSRGDNCSCSSLNSYMKNFAFLKDFTRPYITRSLEKYLEYKGNVGMLSRNDTLCHNTLCCEFDVKMYTTIVPPPRGSKHSTPYGYHYRLAVFDGVKTLGGVTTVGVQICAIVPCIDVSINSCNMRLDEAIPRTMTTVFEHIHITSIYRLTSTFQMPNTMNEKFIPLSAKYFNFDRRPVPTSNQIRITMNTVIANISLLTFGIYGRDFEGDGLQSTSPDTTHPDYEA